LQLLLLVAQWLDVRELLELMLVNHQWRSLLADPYPWKQALLRRYCLRRLWCSHRAIARLSNKAPTGEEFGR
jgi:hypothetical protein